MIPRWVSEGWTLSAPCPAPTLTTLPSGLTVSLWSKLEVSRRRRCPMISRPGRSQGLLYKHLSH